MPKSNELIAQLYAEMARKLLHAAMRPLNGRLELAEEAVQRAFVFACENRESLAASENPRGWIFNALKIAINRMLDEQKRDRELVDRAAAQETVFRRTHHTDEHDLDTLYADLADDPDFILLKRIAVERLSAAEVAELYGIPLETARKRITRARERLRKKSEKF